MKTIFSIPATITLSFLTCLLFGSFGFAQITTEESVPNVTIQYLNIEENGFGGNIVVDVVDERNVPVTDYNSILRSGKEIIFDIPQTGPRVTFFEDGDNLTIEIKKNGYRSFRTKPFSIDEKMEQACVIKIVLLKE